MQRTQPKADPRIDAKEVEAYWGIFCDRTGGAKYLTGEQAAPVLKNSGLQEDQLARVWDLADIDGDGNLDFEEFCVAMRLTFDIINGLGRSLTPQEKESPDVPSSLPDWLVPESKSHLVQAHRALSGKQVQFDRVRDDDEPDSPGLRDGFDWYMSPQDKSKYEQIYLENRDGRGEISFNSLHDLYDTLDAPDTDIRSAWNLINPSARPTINQDAFLAFTHILANRHAGFRIPRTVPPSLRTSFERSQIDYQVDNQLTLTSGEGRPTAATASRWAARPDNETNTGRKAKIGEQYLTRLGRSGYRPSGTEIGARTTEDWEEVRRRRQLQELEEKISRVEADAAARRGGGKGTTDSKSALVKHELSLLLEYKRKQLRTLEESESGSGGAGGNGNGSAATTLGGVHEDLKTVREQVEGLQAHLNAREAVLSSLRHQIHNEKSSNAGDGGYEK